MSTGLCHGLGFPTAKVVVICCDQASPLKKKGKKDPLIAAIVKQKSNHQQSHLCKVIRTFKSGNSNKKVLLFVQLEIRSLPEEEFSR